MIRHALALTVVFVLIAPLGAQQASHFEVASIKPSPAETPAVVTAGVRITPTQARFSYLSLKDYIGLAYNVRVYQIVAPDWIASARFEIAATFPAGFSNGQLPLMMRTLLEERFHMKAHRETRELPAYLLTTLPGFKLEPLTADAPGDSVSITSSSTAASTVVDLGQGASLAIGGHTIEFKKVDMNTLAAGLERFLDRPVVDQTQRAERFNVTIELSQEDFTAAVVRSAVAAGATLPPQALHLLDTASPGAIPDALKTLGLSLEAKRSPIEVVVIDSADRLPTEN